MNEGITLKIANVKELKKGHLYIIELDRTSYSKADAHELQEALSRMDINSIAVMINKSPIKITDITNAKGNK
jgi:hypothetical protein